jgi:hypothetical protein
MKLKRSVEAKDRIAIVRRIQYRRHAIGKDTGHVRVRGHRINEAKLQRWAKEHPMLNLSQRLSRKLMRVKMGSITNVCSASE